MLLKFKEGNRVKIHTEWLENHMEAETPEFKEILKKHKSGVFKILNSDNLPELFVRLESEDEPETYLTLPEYSLDLI